MSPEDRNLLVKAAHIVFEREAHTIRHRFDAAAERPAVRLLTGAYAFREITEEEYGTALARIAANAGKTDINISGHLDVLRPLLPRLALRGHALRLRNTATHRPVLVVLDEPDKGGWKEFFFALFESHRVAIVGREEGAEILRDVARDLAIVFHDFAEGDGLDGRVQMLDRIKGTHFDLPVIVFSKRDDVREMGRCLRAGASGYFCFEPGDGHDRESISTFELFLGVVSDAIPPESWRLLWQELQEFVGPTPGSMGAKRYRRIVGHLRRAYWFLTADRTDPRLRLMARDEHDPESLSRHAAVACGAALEIQVRHLYRELHVNNGTSPKLLKKMSDRVPEMLPKLVEAGRVTPEEAAVIRQIWSVRNAAAHGDSITVAKVESGFSALVKLLGALFEETRM